ncbi:MAG: hypothetical protein HY773_00975 [Candidatus Terrybacteria bacterium]|nr:hypothetical protein [Candidatus Terrybacteria bacterium]
MQTIKQFYLPMRQTILTIIICLAVLGGVSLVYSAPPACNPPDCNTPAPVNIGNTGQTKSGAFTVGGGFESLGQTLFATQGGNVGIGTSEPSYKLSLLGNMGLLRTPGNISPGRGPSITLQSPSNNTSTIPEGWKACGCSVQGACPADTCENNTTSYYTCPSGSGGKECVDVAAGGSCAGGGGTQRYYSNITCETGTDVYNLRTNAGTLEFENSSGVTNLTLGQDGAMNVNNGKLIVGQDGAMNVNNGKLIVGQDGVINSQSGNIIFGGNVGIGTTNPGGLFEIKGVHGAQIYYSETPITVNEDVYGSPYCTTVNSTCPFDTGTAYDLCPVAYVGPTSLLDLRCLTNFLNVDKLFLGFICNKL